MVTTIGPDGTAYTPVIDVSEHQGAVDFQKMKAKGVDGLILRTNHGLTVDARCHTYHRDAIAAGFQPRHIGYYTFCNPKRGSPLACARAFVDTVRSLTGRDDNLLMLDVESYKDQSPDKGVIWPSARYAPWLTEHYDHICDLAPDATVIGYSNASFWNVWVADRLLARRMDWIVPRYPIYSTGGYQLHPLPTPDLWAPWAYARAVNGPIPPTGVTASAWQFSAGYNGQGRVYGCSCDDLDLNIVRADAWARWTGQPVEHPEQPTPAPPPVVTPPQSSTEEEDAMRIKTPGQWFEKVGVDLRAIANGTEYSGLPGAEVTLTLVEMAQLLDTCRYTYGEAKPEMSAAFVSTWNAHREPVSAGSVGEIVFPPFRLTGVITPG